jgi:ABC-type nitrate/sulfonate/bicarbonate transport system permease component
MTAATEAAGEARSPWIRVLSRLGNSFALPIVLVALWGVWETIAASKFFPSPVKIFHAFVETWIGPTFVTDVLPSLTRLAFGLIASIVVGIVAGTLIGLVRWLRELLEPMLEFFRAIPPPAMVPIMALLLGPTDAMKVGVIILGAVWPVLLNTIEGVRSVDSVVKDTARAFGITGFERVRLVIVPAANPRIMAGVRQSMSIGVILMVISEMFYASEGLGFQIVYFQRNYLIADMWSGIVLLGLVGILMAAIFGFVERRVLRWYHGVKEVEHG